jgi:hypothetical protein
MKDLIFEPMVGLPSSNWVGQDIANHLEDIGEYDVHSFNSFEDDNATGLHFIVKLMPSMNWIIRKIRQGSTLIYIPVDYFNSRLKIEKESEKLRLFHGIYVHNSILGEMLSKHNKNVFFINHYLKYKIDYKYKEKGFLLWVGHLEYIPSLLLKLDENRSNHEIKVLTDLENFKTKRNNIKKASLAHGLDWHEQSKSNGIISINGVRLEQWTPERQNIYMAECKAAFDTKEDEFIHKLKPPTKAQKYVFNNIPLATHSTSYSSMYFRDYGLEIPSTENVDYWLSYEYYKTLLEFNRLHGHLVDIGEVSSSYLRYSKSVHNKQIALNQWEAKAKDYFNHVRYFGKRILHFS